jgi:hypothetical protein
MVPTLREHPATEPVCQFQQPSPLALLGRKALPSEPGLKQSILFADMNDETRETRREFQTIRDRLYAPARARAGQAIELSWIIGRRPDLNRGWRFCSRHRRTDSRTNLQIYSVTPHVSWC